MNVSLKNLFVQVYVEGVCERERWGGRHFIIFMQHACCVLLLLNPS